MLSSSKVARVANPATMASWLRPNVVEWTSALSIEVNTRIITSSVHSTAPTGTNPPDNALETVMMSGVNPQCSWAKNLPVRPRPVCTSSATKSAL